MKHSFQMKSNGTTEFAFMSRQDIEENVLDLCNQFKISAKDMEIRAIDYRSVKGKDQSKKYTWSEIDNFYYVSIFPSCGELPLSSITWRFSRWVLYDRKHH